MTSPEPFETEEKANETRRARVVVLGEFSAGKSTLINLLTGAHSLRTQVTATQMPAVWISYGTGDSYGVDLAGKKHPIDLLNPDSISVSETAYIRSFVEAPALKLCDFIDTPGNSDPNIASEAWERVAKIADIAIWCSPSTQAWRQSELSAWKEVPGHVRAKSILLLTRADKLTNETDRKKVLRRVQHEASDQFTHIHMASLINFSNANEVLNDLMALCNTVDSASQVSSEASVAVANSLLDESTSAPEPNKAEVATPKLKGDHVQKTKNDEFDDLEVDLAALASTQDEFDDTDDVLAALTASVPIEPEPAQVDRLDSQAVNSSIQAKKNAHPENTEGGFGYATELWSSMANSIPSDDADAYALAFDMFLERIDSEIANLKNQVSMKAAG